MHTMVTDSIDKVLKTSEMILNEVTWKTTKEETSKMLMSVWITKNFHLILLCIYIYTTVMQTNSHAWPLATHGHLHTCQVSRFRRESHDFDNEITVSRWLLFVSGLMLTNGILTQPNRYPASLLTTLWHRLIVLHVVTRFPKTQTIMVVQP